MATARPHVLAAAALLAVASALRFEAAPRIAVCVTGDTKSIPHKVLRSNLEPFVTGLGGQGLTHEFPDPFAYVTLQSLSKFVPRAWEHPHNKQAASQRLEDFWATYVEADEAVEVQPENSEKYISGEDDCFTSGKWRSSAEKLRSVNQLVLWQSCLKYVSRQEETESAKYDVVVFTKPDVVHTGQKLNMSAVAHNGHAIIQQDMMLAVPRKLAENLLTPGKAKPLKCSRGDACCGKVGSFETMLEYLLGVEPPSEESCGCAPPKVEAALHTEKVTALRTASSPDLVYRPHLPSPDGGMVKLE